MHSATQICVKPNSEFYAYFATITMLANNLRNATLYRVRQVLTMVEKPFGKLTANELEVYNEIAFALPLMGEKYKMPIKGKQFLSYAFLEALMRVTNNQDFMTIALPKQTAQQVLKEVVGDMKGFYAGIRARKKNPSAFTGKPKLPGYGEKGGYHTAIFTNQDCVIYPVKNKPGCHEVKFPGIKKRMFISNMPICGRLMQVTVTPSHGNFILSFIFNDGKEKPVTKPPHRMVGIDLGVDNTAAITNNLGLPCLLVSDCSLPNEGKAHRICPVSLLPVHDSNVCPNPQLLGYRHDSPHLPVPHFSYLRTGKPDVESWRQAQQFLGGKHQEIHYRCSCRARSCICCLCTFHGQRPR